MERVLITGGAGFIGSHTADALIEAGYFVRVLDSLDSQIHGLDGQWPTYLNPQIERVFGNITNRDDVQKSLKDIDIIYHFASCTGVGQSMHEIHQYVNTNINGTSLLLESIVQRQRPLKHFILSSSRAVYGEGPQVCIEHGEFHPYPRSLEKLSRGEFTLYCPWCGRATRTTPVREDQTTLPTSIYGWTKLAQEQLCQQMAKSHGLPLSILRYFNVYGSRQALKNPYTGIMAIFTQQLKSGQSIKLYELGLPVRDFVHISDVVAANLAVLKSSIASGVVFNVGSGESVTIEQIARQLSSQLKPLAPIELTNLNRLGDIFSCVADIAKAKRHLDWEAKTSFEKGLHEFLTWANQQYEAPRTDSRASEQLVKHGLLRSAKQVG